MVMILRWVILLSVLSRRSCNCHQHDLCRDSLVRLRHRARRCGAWFRCLKQSERSLLDLTISVVQRVRSFILAKVISGYVGRLFLAMESWIVRLVRTEGPVLAKRLSETAEAWGHRGARCWQRDRGFMQFLVINNLDVLGK